MPNSASKYSYTEDDIICGEMYHLAEDPQEWNNIYADRSYDKIKNKMESDLIRHLNDYI